MLLPGCLNFLRLAELLFPTPNDLPPKCAVLAIDGLPLKLAALFDLFLEEVFPTE
jgi:hypothetical protein